MSDQNETVFLIRTYTDRFTNNEYYPGEYPVKYFEAKIPDILTDSIKRNTYIRENPKYKNVNKVPNTFSGNLPKNSRYIEQINLEDDLNILNINKVTYDDLIKIQGIGDKSAKKLLNKISEKPLQNLDELTQIIGTVDWTQFNIVFS